MEAVLAIGALIFAVGIMATLILRKIDD